MTFSCEDYLSKAITLIESSKKTDYKKASRLLEVCLPYTTNSVRIGITGVPGVGKSTFIEAFGTHLIKLNKKITVLTLNLIHDLTLDEIYFKKKEDL